MLDGGRTDFKLESLYDGENYMMKDALVVPPFSDDVNILAHSVDTSMLEHFRGVQVPVAPGRSQWRNEGGKWGQTPWGAPPRGALFQNCKIVA